jgi:predicted kinase
MADGCFLILCGIPASGKSTLAKDLIQKEWKIAGKYVHFVYINYDDFIPENLPESDPTHSARWKDRRRDILNSLEQLLLHKESVGLEINNQASRQSTFVSSWCSCGINNSIR